MVFSECVNTLQKILFMHRMERAGVNFANLWLNVEFSIKFYLIFCFITVFCDLPGKYCLAGLLRQTLIWPNNNMFIQHCFLVQRLIWKDFGELNRK